MRSDEHIKFGNSGEELANTYLLSKNYKVVRRNYRWLKAEIDLICKNEDELVFVEVKTRRSSHFGPPHRAVSKQKQKRIIRAANNYIHECRIDMSARFDIISIVIGPNEFDIEHIENAFYPTL